MSWRRITLLATLIVLGTVSATSTAAATTASYSGSVSATGVKWQYKTLSVGGSGPLTETLTWSTSTAKLLVGLSHKNANGTWTWVGGAARRAAGDVDHAGDARYLAAGCRGAVRRIFLHAGRDLSRRRAVDDGAGRADAGVDPGRR